MESEMTKRKTLDRLAEEFVYGNREIESPKQVEETAAGKKEASREASFVERLESLKQEKEPTIRITVDLSVPLHMKLSLLAARTGRKKADIIRKLLEETFEEIDLGETH
jgi:hypothetical protein